MFILRFLGGPIIWISLILILAGVGYGGYMLYDTGNKLSVTDQY